MKRRPAIGLAALVVLVVGAGAMAGVVPPSGDERPSRGAGPDGASGEHAAGPGAEDAEEAASASARAFLDEYVGDDGRVRRPDQGGDTVSEGQAYGLLLALAVDDQERFDRIWSWTAEHLRRADGLLAWLWDDGRVVDDDPASDADLDAARALLVAGERWGRSDLVASGHELADAVVAHEVATAADGPVLLAGPWAVGPPTVVNPSYGSPRAYDELLAAGVTGPWAALADAERDRLRTLGALPPDWAHLESDGSLVPAGPPATPGDEPIFSFDAARVPVRLAESCDPADRALAATMREPLGDGDEARLGLDGRPVDDVRHPLALVARAAAADADGDDAAAGRLLEQAAALEEDQPGYYASAWVALGRVLLTTDLLGPC